MTGRSIRIAVSCLATAIVLGPALAQAPVQITPPAQSEGQPARPAKRPAAKAPVAKAPAAKDAARP